MPQTLGWRAHHMHARKRRQTRFNPRIAPVQLRPRLLQQNRPQLIRFGAGGERPIPTTRDVIIDNNCFFLAVHEEVD